MARLDQVVESRTLVRSCFENLFLVDQLRKDGAGFVKKMRSHEAKIRILLSQLALKHHGSAESPFGQIVRDLIKSERLMSPEKLAVSDTAEGEMEKRYLAYLLLSHDAAHALSLVALERHFQLHQDGRMTMNVIPPFLPEERLATLDMACDAVLGACMGISLVLGVTSQNEAVHALFGGSCTKAVTLRLSTAQAPTSGRSKSGATARRAAGAFNRCLARSRQRLCLLRRTCAKHFYKQAVEAV